MNGKDVRKLVIACDAGMGSSVMLAGQLRRALKKHDVTVEHTPVDSIPADADVVVSHTGLADRARRGAGDAPVHLRGLPRRPRRRPAGQGHQGRR